MSIGERIAELRKIQKLSQGQLASSLGVSRQAVSKWENDQSAPDSIKMIHLADILDTDIEYLTTGRRNYSRRPPVVINSVETVEIERIVETPVIQTVEKVIEKIVEKPVEVVRYIDKPVIKKVYRIKYRRDPMELLLTGMGCFLLGLAIGWICL